MGNTSSHETGRTLTPFPDGHSYWSEFEKEPFDNGIARYAFKGTYHGRGTRDGDQCVVKVFKNKYSSQISDWKPDLKAHKTAEDMAKKFNRDHPSNKPISFRQPVIARVTDVAQFKLFGFIPVKTYDSVLARQEYVSLEDYIPGYWKKYNSNNGYDRGISDLIPAFTHYTYYASGGELIVCDLQGVGDKYGYTLTDPAVCSRSQTFGITDVGTTGMATFFKHHKCTKFCASVPLPEIDNRSREVVHFHSKRSSSYTFDLTPQQKRANQKYRHRNDLPAIKED